MRRLARIVRTTYTVVDRGLPTGAQRGPLPFGCAYAIPKEFMSETPIEQWLPCSIGAVFARRNVTALDLTRIDLTMRWLVNPTSGYIIGGHLDVMLTDGEALTVMVTYQQPFADSSDGGYIIPFRGAIARDQLPRNPSVPFTGSIGPRDTGSFTVGRR